MNVLANDVAAGVAATPANVTVSAVTAPPAALTLAADGNVTVAPGTMVGSYAFSYRIEPAGLLHQVRVGVGTWF